jgi:quinol monooxygenase YgiN
MIARYVKMTFRPEGVEAFLKNFAENKDKIASFAGCTHLELQHNEKEPAIYSTYSTWNSTDDLNVYRKSELFYSVWSKVKPLFAAAPQTKTIDLETQQVIELV